MCIIFINLQNFFHPLTPKSYKHLFQEGLNDWHIFILSCFWLQEVIHTPFIPVLQPPFQPGSTPVHLMHRFMVSKLYCLTSIILSWVEHALGLSLACRLHSNVSGAGPFPNLCAYHCPSSGMEFSWNSTLPHRRWYIINRGWIPWHKHPSPFTSDQSSESHHGCTVIHCCFVSMQSSWRFTKVL